MKKILFFIFLIFLSVFGVKAIFAQETASNSAATAHLAFPITELGNCSSAADCKTYCDDPTHLDACIAYAKEKGFYKESNLDSSKDTILTDAKTTLGCDSLDSCRTFCQQAVNATACSDFAKKHNLKGGQQQLSNQTLAKAEQTLGCTSEASCKAFCQDSANKDKCAAFAKDNGLQGGDQKIGPGGCTSEDSCKTFCLNPDNFQACSQFVQNHSASGSAQKSFTGPGGCTSEDSCKTYCSQNPTACHRNPVGHEVPMSATAAANVQNNCREHPQMCQPTGQALQHAPNGQQDNTAGSSGNITPHVMQTNPANGEHHGGNIPGGDSHNQQSNQGPNLAFPTVSQSVKAAATHRDFLSWLVDTFFHLQ